MTFHLVYRLHPPENNKRRPLFHSKTRCLKSALDSLSFVPDARLLLLVDDSSLPAAFEDLLRVEVPVERVLLGGVGNAASYKHQLNRVLKMDPADVVYLSEDDYLYAPAAFSVLSNAMSVLEDVHYFSLYDHPDRYSRIDDARIRASRPVYFAAGRHWRRSESACMTFGARVSTLVADKRIHARFTPAGGYRNNIVSRALHYNDRRTWRMLQGIGQYAWKRPARRLVTPIPSLSTHMDESFLAPAVDWQAVAEATGVS